MSSLCLYHYRENETGLVHSTAKDATKSFSRIQAYSRVYDLVEYRDSEFERRVTSSLIVMIINYFQLFGKNDATYRELRQTFAKVMKRAKINRLRPASKLKAFIFLVSPILFQFTFRTTQLLKR